MEEKDFENLKDLNFTITKEMKILIAQMLVIRQILNECNLSKKDTRLLEKEFKRLKNQFVQELSVHNENDLKILRDYLNNKEIDK